jgi:hypothetical protein
MNRLIWKPLDLRRLGGITPGQIEEETGIPADELIRFHDGAQAFSAGERLAVMCELGGWPRPALLQIPDNVKAHRIGCQAYTHLVIEALIEMYEEEFGTPFGEAPGIGSD